MLSENSVLFAQQPAGLVSIGVGTLGLKTERLFKAARLAGFSNISSLEIFGVLNLNFFEEFFLDGFGIVCCVD